MSGVLCSYPFKIRFNPFNRFINLLWPTWRATTQLIHGPLVDAAQASHNDL